MLNLESEHILFRSNSPWRLMLDWIFTFNLAILRILYLVWRKNLRIVQLLNIKYRSPVLKSERHPGVRKAYPEFLIGKSSLWKPEGVDCFSWDVVRAYDWRQQLHESPTARLAPQKQRQAEQLRVEMGIPKEDWFVVLHVREGLEGDLYSGRFHERIKAYNASILNYIEAIRLITTSGGWVVRLGDTSMTRLPPLERVIDYPFTSFKSELMDMYLLSECRFFVGMGSGPYLAARLFQKPEILVNMGEWTIGFPVHKGDLCIPKHVFSRSRNRFLSLNEILDDPLFDLYLHHPVGDDYVLVENTPEEIRDVVEQFLNQTEGNLDSELQEEFNRRRRLQFYRALEVDYPPALPMSWIVEKYRFATRAEVVEGAIGQKFLEQNWNIDSAVMNQLDESSISP